jgi:uncharacterized protein (DUF2237 family)
MPIPAPDRDLSGLKPGDWALVALKRPAIPQACQAQYHQQVFFKSALLR